MKIRQTVSVLAIIGFVLPVGCTQASISQTRGVLPDGKAKDVPSGQATPSSHLPWRSQLGVTQPDRIGHRSGAVLVREVFSGTSTPNDAWLYQQDACLTAGTASTPQGSIPACGANAPQDPPGDGALQLTPPVDSQLGFVCYYQPLPTAGGLDIQFDLYAFDTNSSYGRAADGMLLFLADGSQGSPMQLGGDGGGLGYVPSDGGPYGLQDGYLGIGFDEWGDFSYYLPGGPGFTTETVAVGGSEAIGYHYLGGVVNGSGRASSLPFDLDVPNAKTRPKRLRRIDVQLTNDGLLQVSIQTHKKQAFVTYVSLNTVGLFNQPAIPSSVWVGFIGSTGGFDNRHQIRRLTISTLK